MNGEKGRSWGKVSAAAVAVVMLGADGRCMGAQEQTADPAEGAAVAPADATEAAAQNNEKLRALIEEVRAKHKAPALAGAAWRDGEAVAVAAEGVRRDGDDTPVTDDDRFHIGSCTKAMTATLAGVFVERGLIRWESTVEDVLPAIAASGRVEYRAVTLEQLLWHRSGIPGAGHGKESGAIWGDIWRLSSGDMEMREQRRRAAALILGLAPIGPAGDTFDYSNYGYMVAGAMLEEVGGDTWENLMQREVFAPLDMTSAGFGPPGAGGDARAQPWGHQPGPTGSLKPVEPGPGADNPAVLGPAGTVHVSVNDWLKFAALHCRGARGEEGLLLKPETFARMHARPRDAAGNEVGDYAMGWGLTAREWARGDEGTPGLVLTHGGSNTMWNAVAWIAPERNAAFVAANNLPLGDAGGRANDEVIWGMVQRFLLGQE